MLTQESRQFFTQMSVETRDVRSMLNASIKTITTHIEELQLTKRLLHCACVKLSLQAINNKTTAVRIRTARAAINMSSLSLAEAIGVPHSCVDAWEDGTTSPTSDKILPLASLLQCEPLWLLGNSPSTEHPTVEVMSGVDTSTTGERIHLARQNLGIHEADLARLLNTYSDHISDWECGVSEPPASMVVLLANALKCDPMWLLTGESVAVARES